MPPFSTRLTSYLARPFHRTSKHPRKESVTIVQTGPSADVSQSVPTHELTDTILLSSCPSPITEPHSIPDTIRDIPGGLSLSSRLPVGGGMLSTPERGRVVPTLVLATSEDLVGFERNM